MKKILSLLMILMLASSTAMAAEKKSSKSKKKEAAKKEEKKAEKKSSSMNSGSEKGSFVLQFQGGLNFMLSSSMGSTFLTGVGGEISGAYAFNKNFSIGFMTGLESNEIKGSGGFTGDWSYTPTEFVFQYNFGGSTSPFLTLGLGIANSQISEKMTGYSLGEIGSESEFIFSPGVGLAFEVDEKTNFFIQTRLDILTPSADWTSEFGSFISPGVFLPFQVGVNFSGL